MRDYILNDVKEGGPIHYVGEDGSEKIRVGSYKGHWHGPAHVLTGGISGFHPRKGLPYTVRERARLQGFPDDFAFYGTVLDQERGQRVWNHDRNMHMVRQTGKAMPIQFCEYVSEQIKAHIIGMPYVAGHAPATNTRVIQPNAYVDEAKRWYCGNVGYANQAGACGSCQMAAGCDIREGLHIPMPRNPARLLGLPTRSQPATTTGSLPVTHRETPESPSIRTLSKKKPSGNKDLTPAREAPVARKGVASPRKSKIVVPTKMLEF